MAGLNPTPFWAAELLHVWFHKLGPGGWFAPHEFVDTMLRRRFGHDLRALASRPPGSFLATPLTALAAVLLFDQVPRNLFRGSPTAFAYDALARAIARAAIARGWNRRLSPEQQQFLALPLMHSEAIADQRLSLRLFARLGRRHGCPFAVSHHRMISRFGGFPHRNRVLGRHSSAAEDRAVAQGFAW